MRSHLRSAPAVVSTLLALIMATLVFPPGVAQADPPPPFIAQLPASLSSPSGIASDAAGNVYIADTGNNRILKYSSIGSLLASWGAPGSANGQFNQPWGIAVDAANVYVGDSGNNRVQKFTQAGTFVSAWAVTGAHGVALDGLGDLLVSGTSTIVKYTIAGALITSWGSAGAGNSQFNAPLGIAADAAGNVYVADTNNNRVQKFTGAGAYVTQWGGLVTPDGVCLDNGGHVIVTETGGYRIDAYTGAGALISQWGTQGAGAGQFQLARAVATNASGNVLVLDTGNQRLQVFGTVTSSVMAADLNPSVFGQPVTLTASVSPATVSGVVYFKDNGAVIGTAGVGGLIVSNFAVGNHPLTAFYGGDANSAASTSSIVALTVNKAATSTVVTSSFNPSGPGQSVTFTVTVSPLPPGTGTPTGSVTLLVDGAPSTLALTAGVAAFPSGTLSAGSHAVSAGYGGDASFLAGNSTTLTQTLVLAESGMPYFSGWGSLGNLAGQFHSNFGIAVGGGFVYVVEQANHRVQKFDTHGKFLTTWGSSGTTNGLFFAPTGVALDATGVVYIADTANDRVQKFAADGTYLSQWGTVGTGDGQFDHPYGIAIDATGNVYVSDTNHNRIEKFTTAGTFVSKWGSSGSGNGQFSSPSAIAVGPNGNVYVGEFGNARVQEFSASGAYVTQWRGIGPGNSFASAGLGVDRDGDVYATDPVCGCVQKFTSSGAYLSQTSPGPGNASLGSAAGIAVDAFGNAFVNDALGARVVEFAHLPTVTAVTDVGGDQGHQVRLRIAATGADTVGSATVITGYEVYRRITAANGVPATTSHTRTSPMRALSEGWDYVATVPARGDTSYYAVVPTLADSGAGGTHWSAFFVSATTSSPTLSFFSAPDSGYSVDNLPPATPAPFTAAYAAGATDLHWGRNTEADLWYYRIYRGSTAGFVPSPANLVATRSDTGYVDPGTAGQYYALSAVDVDGNESGFATLAPTGTLAVRTPQPLAFALSGTHPNPARGNRLDVEFVLVRQLPARLELLDVTGRRVVAREVGSLGIGRHAVDLAAGRSIPPGVYLVRLTQGRETRSVRTVVLD